MTIDVRAPDGNVYRFRDEEQAARILREMFPEQAPQRAAPEEDADRFNRSGLDDRAGFLDAALQSATFNTLDEITAGVTAPFSVAKRAITGEDAGKSLGERFSDAYGSELDYQRARFAEQRRNRPGQATAGDIGGALVPLGAAGQAVRGATTLAGRIGRGAGVGAASGAAAGFGAGEGAEDRLNQAGLGGVIGAGVGGALPVATGAIGAAGSRVSDAVRGRRRPADYAAQKVEEAIADAGKTPERIVQELEVARRQLGQQSMAPVDRMGEPGQKLLRNVVNAPGPGARNVATRISARNQAQGGRIGRSLERMFADPQNYGRTKDAIIEARRTAARPLYERAYQTPITPSRELQELLETPAGRRAYERAQQIARNRRQPTGTRYDPENVRAVEDFDTMYEGARAMRPREGRPETLSQFLRRTGGFDPDSPDVSDIYAMADRAGGGRGLIRRGGYRSLDEAAEAAHEAGYLDARDVRELAAKLDYDLRQGGVVSRADEELAARWGDYDEFVSDLDRHFGASPNIGREEADRVRQSLLGEGTPMDLTRVETWDNVKRALDDLVENQRTIDLGPFSRRGLTNEGRAIDSVRRSVLAEVDRLSPDYAAARRAALDNIEADEALEFGRKAFNRTAEQVRREMAGLTEGQREMARLGFAEQLRAKIEDTGSSTGNALRRILGNKKQVDIMRAMFPDQRSFNEFMRAMFNEARMQATVEAARGNSTTAKQLMSMMDSGGLREAAADVATDVVTGTGPLVAASRYVGSALRQLGGFTPEVANEVQRILLATSPERQQQFLTALQQIAASRQSAAELRNVVRGLVTGFTGMQAEELMASPDSQ